MRWFEKLAALVLLMFLALWLLRPMWVSLPSQPPGPIVTASVTSMNNGHKVMAHATRITVRDDGGRIG